MVSSWSNTRGVVNSIKLSENLRQIRGMTNHADRGFGPLAAHLLLPSTRSAASASEAVLKAV